MISYEHLLDFSIPLIKYEKKKNVNRQIFVNRVDIIFIQCLSFKDGTNMF